jgi:hypothetical protein
MAAPPGSVHGERLATDVLNALRVLHYQGPYRPSVLSVPIVRTTNGNGPDTFLVPPGTLGGDLIVVAQAINSTATLMATPGPPGMRSHLIRSTWAGRTRCTPGGRWQRHLPGWSTDGQGRLSLHGCGCAGRYRPWPASWMPPGQPGHAHRGGRLRLRRVHRPFNVRTMPAHAMSQAARVVAIATDQGAPCSQSAVPGPGYTNLGDTAITGM